MKLIAFKENPKKPPTGFLKIENGDVVIEAWTPEIPLAEPLVGKELEGWLIREGDRGWQALPPKKGGGKGQSSWYNSEVGVRYTQERMDRRTALMQAVAIGSDLKSADAYYAWLRATDGGGGTTKDPKPSASPTTRDGEGAVVGAEGGETGAGEPGGSTTDKVSPSEDLPSDPSAGHVFKAGTLKTATGKPKCEVCRIPEAMHA